MNHLEEHDLLLNRLGEPAAGVVRAAWTDACRYFSPLRLEKIYLKGAGELQTIGRDDAIVAAFLRAAPAVAAEIGEHAAGDLLDTVQRLLATHDGAVLVQLALTSPLAARRLGSRELFAAYLSLAEQLAAQAPRSLSPMLEHIDQLLGQLTLGGLRRWASWGAQAHRSDHAAQERYFALASPEALAVLQQERRGTLFVDVQRRIGMYLRALWGHDFFLRPGSSDGASSADSRPYIDRHVIYLPDAIVAWQDIPAVQVYRAAAAHAAAHIVGSVEPMSGEGLNPLQRAVVEVVEDARVEALARRRLPGLAALWTPFHGASLHAEGSVGAWLDRLAQALARPAYEDPHPWIAKARQMWAERAGELTGNALSWDIGVALAYDLAGFAAPFNASVDFQSAPYRDDNRYLWAFDDADGVGTSQAPLRRLQARPNGGLLESMDEIEAGWAATMPSQCG